MEPTDIAAVLREHGHRVTRPRQAVWEALVERGGHVTAKELYEHVVRRETGVNLASVYRSLILFAELGLARESRTGEEASEWELSHPDASFHVVCEMCGRVDHHGGDYVEEIRHHLRTDHDFEARMVELRVRGICARCKALAASG